MIIDGKKIADEIQNEIAQEISTRKGRAPCLAVLFNIEVSQFYSSPL